MCAERPESAGTCPLWQTEPPGSTAGVTLSRSRHAGKCRSIGLYMPTKPKTLAARVLSLRAAAVKANAAVNAMAHAAAATNPNRMLRRWTAQQRVRNLSKRAK